MADVFATAGAGGNGCRLDWILDFDDAVDTVTITATHTHFDGSPAPDPQQAQITVKLNTSFDVTVDLLTGLLIAPDNPAIDGRPFVQGAPGKLINAGPKTRTSVRLRVSATRARLLDFSTQYLPPA